MPRSGSAALIPLINRDVYPPDQFPAGQFEYMESYHKHFDAARRSFEANTSTMFKAVMRRGDPSDVGKPYITAFVRKRGGWFGPNGQAAPDLPLYTAVLAPADLDAYVGAYERTGFFGVNALCMNDIENRAYFDAAPASLELPVLFLSGAYDFVCDTEHSELAAPMRAACRDLTFVTIRSGHWMTREQPAAVSDAISHWVDKRLPSFSPQAGKRGDRDG